MNELSADGSFFSEASAGGDGRMPNHHSDQDLAGDAERPVGQAGQPGHAPHLSLCMIVRDSARTLAACLESIRPWVDEIIVVDTGSQDDTRDIALRYSARLFEFPWCDDFSAARNESIRHATGQWLFWMDSDDTIDEANGRKLRSLVDGPHSEGTLGYVMQVVCPGLAGAGSRDVTVVDHIKLFRNLPQLRFEFRIHEQLLPSIRRMGGDVGWTDIAVVHSGSDQTPTGRQRKYERDLRILALELEERPNHPFALFNMGMTYSDMGEHTRAAEYLERSLKASTSSESHVRKVHALLVHCFDQLGDFPQAERVCRRGLADYPDDPELQFRLGKLSHQTGKLDDARVAFRRVLASRGDRHFTSIDRGVLGYKARFNLALVYQAAKQLDLAEYELRRALDEESEFVAAIQLLADTLLARRRLTAARLLVKKCQNAKRLELTGRLIAADLALCEGNTNKARIQLQQAINRFPANVEAVDSLCKLEFEQQNDAAARMHLERLVELAPDNPAAHHNLGAILIRLGDLPAAQTALERSLSLRPDSGPTQSLLQQTLDSLGDGNAKV